MRKAEELLARIKHREAGVPRSLLRLDSRGLQLTKAHGEAMIEVVSALIVEHGRVLLTQRRPDQDFAGCWESPGGKVEGNEAWHDALRRELREEVGVELSGISEHALWCGEIERPGKGSVFVLLLRADLTPGSVPRPLEVRASAGSVCCRFRICRSCRRTRRR